MRFYLILAVVPGGWTEFLFSHLYFTSCCHLVWQTHKPNLAIVGSFFWFLKNFLQYFIQRAPLNVTTVNVISYFCDQIRPHLLYNTTIKTFIVIIWLMWSYRVWPTAIVINERLTTIENYNCLKNTSPHLN